jgi:hypothetical protein
MQRFLYLRDPLFLAASSLYTLNRAFLKPHFASPFLRNWFNDLLLIPCALPVLLWFYRKLNLRQQDDFPGFWETTSILVFWSLLFEWIGPKFIQHAVGDWRDVAMYWLGGLIAWLFWKSVSRQHLIVSKSALAR